MPAPTPAATPHAPAGVRIENGHPTIISLALDPDFSFWETDVTPPGIDGGDANDLTNMHNTAWRTYAARTLKQLTEVGATGQYTLGSWTNFVTLVNEPTTVTIHFPGGGTLAFYGYVRSWIPGAAVEGEPPTSTLAVMPTNRDPSDDTEQPPVVTLPVGLMRRMGGRFVPVGSPISSKGKTAQEAMGVGRVTRKKTAVPKVSVPRPTMKKFEEEKAETGSKT